jgi:cytochrome c556
MKRCGYLVGGIVLLVGLALVPPMHAQGEKLTVKEVMGKVNKGPTALFPTIRKGLNADAPDWPELQKQAKEISSLVDSLGKKEPPRGEKESWAKFTKAYAADAKTLADAAEKKDKDAMIGAHAKITKACTACHNMHRPQ